jgi:hypothetical protein
MWTKKLCEVTAYRAYKIKCLFFMVPTKADINNMECVSCM